MKKSSFTKFGILLFLVFGFFSFLVAKDFFTSFDFDTTVKIQNLLPEKVVGIFSLFSLLGSAEIASLFLLLVLFVFKVPKRIVVLMFYVLTGVIELSGKMIIEHQGPPIMFLKTNLAIHFPTSYIPHDFFSYPSGHSARTAFVSIILIVGVLISKKLNDFQKKIIIAGVLGFDFIMFLSRVYLGEHWITDVIGGALLGFSLALIAGLFFIKPQIYSKK